ncbi:jg3182 [Pararge aegeria aegeria]|uniref:Jg3182 protein n=1 Tax=Pararge aegeria aegeria TaxID=348720 RepID=A0A8S4QU62_9NEOP|nr:jg3182 [Pararge aegeria aegeria]
MMSTITIANAFWMKAAGRQLGGKVTESDIGTSRSGGCGGNETSGAADLIIWHFALANTGRDSGSPESPPVFK